MKKYLITIDDLPYEGSEDLEEARNLYKTLDRRGLFYYEGHPKALYVITEKGERKLEQATIRVPIDYIMKYRPYPVIIYPDGTIKEAVKAGEAFTLEELQRHVCGLIQVVPLDDDSLMIMNEEGKLLGMAGNDRATRIFQKYNGGHDPIVGPAIICKNDELK